MKIKLNSDKHIVKELRQRIKDNDGYCPCQIIRNEETKCICKNFREQNTAGLCHCGLYIKVEENQ